MSRKKTDPKVVSAKNSIPARVAAGEFCPAPLEAKPRAPELVMADPIAKERWNAIVADLVKQGVLARCDLPLLEVLVLALADYQRATLVIREEGAVIDTKQGAIPHPSTKVKNFAAKTIENLAPRFGIGPSSRRKVAQTPEGTAGRTGKPTDMFA